ncbi:cytosine methyltransferase [Escherichia coli]|nr:cytosine methyltransferase [Escherichia coli]
MLTFPEADPLEAVSGEAFRESSALEEVGTNESSVVSFFCGCGGLDLGFLGGFEYKGKSVPKLPFKLVSAYDNDVKCIDTYNENISNHGHVKDLSDFDPAEIPSAKVLIGGFPCQDFATCGPRHGLSSKRGRLYQSLISYMDIHKPLVVVGENVPGLANMDQGKVLETIKDDLKNAGYKVQVWTLYAPDYGVPQRRTRLFIIAVRQDLDGFPSKPEVTHYEDDYLTTSWAIADLEKVTDESIPNQSQFFRAARAKNGNGQGDERTQAHAPSYTIRANAKSRVQFHYSLDRRLTVRECARLQTFPDSFKFPHSATSNIMQIGNAVPPLLANKVAQSIASFLEMIK